MFPGPSRSPFTAIGTSASGLSGRSCEKRASPRTTSDRASDQPARPERSATTRPAAWTARRRDDPRPGAARPAGSGVRRTDDEVHGRNALALAAPDAIGDDATSRFSGPSPRLLPIHPRPTPRRGCVAPSDGRSGHGPYRHESRTARGTHSAFAIKQHPHLLAVDVGIRVHRAALRGGLEAGEFDAEVREPTQGRRLRPGLAENPRAAVRMSRSARGWITT